jgi:chromosome segregation protein
VLRLLSLTVVLELRYHASILPRGWKQANVMKIKRLEISGFKSFVEKATFDFPAGVTAVVGPNGCGKSNVVDAIRWVMGEQSAKNLRGRQMEDVIFGGSESRKPLGMAEVSLVFSTADGHIPAKYLNYSEIQVTRRLYRDGESEYLLNKTPCRLMDITELFMDTGVGARAYSIIEQGRIGMILMAKPEERRFLIEEAAGVTKYKSRKLQALKKIEATRQNLLRIGDIVAEIRRQLNSLQRQAKKAERFRTVREELRGIELFFAARRHGELRRSRSDLEEEVKNLSSREQAVLAELEAKAGVAERIRVDLFLEEQQLSAVQEEIFKGKAEVQGVENRIEYQRKEALGVERQLVRAREELVLLEKQLEDALAEQGALELRSSEFRSESSGEEQSLADRQTELDELVAAERAAFAAQEEGRRRLFGLLAEISQVANQNLAAGKRFDGLAERAARSRSEELALRERLEESSGLLAGLEERLAGERRAIGELGSSIEELTRREVELKQCISADDASLQEARDNLSRMASRLQSLQELEAQFAGYGQGVRTLFQADGYRQRFCGIVADAVEADDEYEAAVEAVLGERLQAVIASGPTEVLAAVDFLRGDSGGRCSFLLPGVAHHPPKAMPTDCEPLLQKVRIAADLRGIVEPLLRNVLLVEDLARAMELSVRHPEVTFVTLNGDVAFAGGLVDGGSREAAGQGLIHKKREIRELTSGVRSCEALVADRTGVRESRRAELRGVEEELQEARQTLHRAEIALLTHQKDRQRVQEECQRLEERLSVKSLEDEQLVEEEQQLTREMTAAEARRESLEGQKAGLEETVAQMQESLVQKRQAIEVAREELTSMKVRAAALREKRESTDRSLQRVQQLQRDLTARMARQREEQARGESSLEQLLAATAEAEDQLRQLVLRHGGSEENLARVRERYETQAQLLRQAESAHRELRGNADELHRRLADLNLQITSQSLELNSLEEMVRERYRLDVADLSAQNVRQEGSDEELRQRQAELQKQVEEIGEVNLTAIEEYQELEERYNFLSSQKADLEESLHSLQQAIQRINRTTRKRFAETFELVNEKFKDVFPRLFCGGRAELKLTNEEDMLETGLDIIVQPPGKKLQNVSLLSGGEKALTAVALIFSIFLIKPSPFCLLDEVDAPLDDANIGRFNDMIREMSAFSQFILITHSKTTMAVADTLYGVTMEEPGVSKLVSVKLQ